MEATQVSTNERMDEPNGVCTHREWLLSLTEGGDSDTCSNKDEPWGCDAPWNKPDRKGQTLCKSTDVIPRVVKWRREVKGGSQGPDGEQASLLGGQSFTLGRGAELCGCVVVTDTTVNTQGTWCHWSAHLKVVKIGNFMLRIFYDNKQQNNQLNQSRSEKWGKIKGWSAFRSVVWHGGEQWLEGGEGQGPAPAHGHGLRVGCWWEVVR